jgi:hypothetical protein
MCYVKVAGSINICIHMKIVVQPQVITLPTSFMWSKTWLVYLNILLTWTAEFIKQVAMVLILSRDHIHTYCWGFSWSQSPSWPLYAFATSTKCDITEGWLMNIVRNSYPVLKEAVGFCEALQTVYCDLFVHSLVQSEWTVTTAWIKFDVCRALYPFYKMKVMQ